MITKGIFVRTKKGNLVLATGCRLERHLSTTKFRVFMTTPNDATGYTIAIQDSTRDATEPSDELKLFRDQVVTQMLHAHMGIIPFVDLSEKIVTNNPEWAIIVQG